MRNDVKSILLFHSKSDLNTFIEYNITQYNKMQYNMKYIITIICSIILPIFSLTEITPKLCIDCKFFRHGAQSGQIVSDAKYGKCALYPVVTNTQKHVDFLVTGVKGIQVTDYLFCNNVRSFSYMCGIEGKFFEKKNISTIDL